MAEPGRTSRTMPATGVSIGSVISPLATRQRPRHSNSSSPSATRRPGRRHGCRPGWPARSRRASRSRSAMRRPGHDRSRPAATSGRSPGREAERDVEPARRAAARAATRPRPVARSSPSRTRPTAPACQAASRSRRRSARSGSRSGHVAQVDEQAGQAAPDVDREVAAARRQPDRVAEAELGHRRLARAPGRPAPGHPGTRSSSVVVAAGVDDEAAGRSTGPQPGRGHDAAERREQVVGEVAPCSSRRSSGSGIAPSDAEQPGVVEGVLAGARCGGRHRRWPG